MPIVPHWRYPIQIKPVKNMKEGDAANATFFTMQTHWYTHIDAPLHQVDGGKTMQDYPIENTIGKATVLDISYVEANQPVTAEMLKERKGLKEFFGYK